MFEFLARLFRGEPSGATAKERLRLVLLSDHLALAPDVVESLKTDLLEVISRYVEVDIEHVDVTFEQREHEVAMLANVPILSLKTPAERPRPAVAAIPPAVVSPAPEPAAEETVAAAPGVPDAASEVTAPASDVALLMIPAEASPAKPSRSRRRRRRKGSISGTQSEQAKSGAVNQPHL